MNAREFYQTIGQIDDGLILAAGEQPVRKKRFAMGQWALAAAACVCLVLGGAWVYFFNAPIVWNEGAVGAVSNSKLLIPAGSTPRELSEMELAGYYQLDPLPDVLGDDLRQVHTGAALYVDDGGAVVHDFNQVRYESADGNRGVTVTLSRISPAAPAADGARASRIHGNSVVLTQDSSIPGYLLLEARWERHGTTVCLSAEGLDKEEFTAIAGQLIGG